MVGKNRFYKESKLGARNKVTYQTSNLPVTEAADHPMVPQSKADSARKIKACSETAHHVTMTVNRDQHHMKSCTAGKLITLFRRQRDH